MAFICVRVTWVCACTCVSVCARKKTLSRPSPSVSGIDCLTNSEFLSIITKKKRERRGNIPCNIFLGIWSWTAGSSSGWCQTCFWKRDLGKGVLRNRCVCVRSWMGEAVIILVCTAALEPCCGTLLYCTPSAVIKTKTHRGYTRPARHCQVTNPSRHNGTAPSLVIIAWSVWGLQAANCTKCSHAFTYISRNITKTRGRGWEGQTYSTYMAYKTYLWPENGFTFFDWFSSYGTERKHKCVCLCGRVWVLACVTWLHILKCCLWFGLSNITVEFSVASRLRIIKVVNPVDTIYSQPFCHWLIAGSFFSPNAEQTLVPLSSGEDLLLLMLYIDVD